MSSANVSGEMLAQIIVEYGSVWCDACEKVIQEFQAEGRITVRFVETDPYAFTDLNVQANGLAEANTRQASWEYI